MKIVADSHIPYLDLPSQAQVVKLDHITSADVRDADVLLVRTRTRCDAALLQGSLVRFIGTATIGTDHIDMDYCHRRGITVRNAPGCNAPAVAQWVLASIGHWMAARGIGDTTSLTLGIVGVGHVGSIVARWARELGFNVVLNDPPRQAAEGGDTFSTLDAVQQQSDIITFHTPLTRHGQWPTWHLCDERFLQRAGRCRLLMNAARGSVCDTQALLRWNGDLAIDCWEGEPHISDELLRRAFIATPHIAGYSRQGKQRGTQMLHDALNVHFGWHIMPIHISTPPQGAEHVTLPGILASYNPLTDTAALKADPTAFESLRNHYPLRPEVPELP
ncbi:MAG: 4-phosphoerythronate dehydrogenase [Muribaculaceae bacterium]|nr:4-phosphoerythronate dehydrogenase [Muribaculaceae bacterium]